MLLTGGIVLLGRRASLSGFDAPQFLDALLRGNPVWLSIATLLTLVSFAVRAARWRIMLVPRKPNASFWNIFSATAVGYTALILFGRPGELVRPYLIARKENIPFASQMAAWLLERIYDLLVVLVLFGFAIGSVSRSEEFQGSRFVSALSLSGYAVAMTGMLCLIALAVLHRFSHVLEQRLMDLLSFLQERRRERAERAIRSVMQGFESARDGRLVVQMFLYTAWEWVVLVAVFLCIFAAYPETTTLDVSRVLLVVGVTTLGGIVQIPAVGGGAQIAATLALTELFHISLGTATGIALVIWVVNFVCIVPFGVFFAMREGLRWSSLRHIEDSTK